MLSQLSHANEPHKRVPREKQMEKYAGESPIMTPSVWHTYVNPHGEGVLHLNSDAKKDHGKQNCERYTIEYDSSYKAVYVKTGFLDKRAAGIMVKDKFFGEGAERIVFAMTEIDESGASVGVPLVAKESRFEHDNRSGRDGFHFNFMMTQKAAGKLAKKFNARLDMLKVDRSIPRLTFLECFVYSGDKLHVQYLAEKRLNPQLYRKWNNNAGGVDGVIRKNLDFVPIPVGAATAAAGVRDLGALQEDDEDEDEDEREDDEEDDTEEKGALDGIVASSSNLGAAETRPRHRRAPSFQPLDVHVHQTLKARLRSSGRARGDSIRPRLRVH